MAGLSRRAIRLGKSAVLSIEPSRRGAVSREPLAAEPAVADFAGIRLADRNKTDREIPVDQRKIRAPVLS